MDKKLKRGLSFVIPIYLVILIACCILGEVSFKGFFTDFNISKFLFVFSNLYLIIILFLLRFHEFKSETSISKIFIYTTIAFLSLEILTFIYNIYFTLNTLKPTLGDLKVILPRIIMGKNGFLPNILFIFILLIIFLQEKRNK